MSCVRCLGFDSSLIRLLLMFSLVWDGSWGGRGMELRRFVCPMWRRDIITGYMERRESSVIRGCEEMCVVHWVVLVRLRVHRHSAESLGVDNELGHYLNAQPRFSCRVDFDNVL